MSVTTEQPALTPAARRILDAASDLYYRRGITSVGMDLVAEQAGTTKKTIYDRFGSKDGLVVAYLEARAVRWQSYVTGRLDEVEGSAADRAVAVLDALESWLEAAERGCGFVNAYAELSTSSERATVVVRAEKQWMRDLYGRVLAEGGVEDDGSLARRLALVHEGAIIESTAGGSAYALDDARHVMRSLLGGGVSRA
ncbi:MAG: TetR/AcrR family transcriptional regulator [Marmoricola sp.]